jgi:hypothetical protein
MAPRPIPLDFKCKFVKWTPSIDWNKLYHEVHDNTTKIYSFAQIKNAVRYHYDTTKPLNVLVKKLAFNSFE